MLLLNQMPFQGPAPGAEGSMVNANGQFDMNAMMMMGMMMTQMNNLQAPPPPPPE